MQYYRTRKTISSDREPGVGVEGLGSIAWRAVRELINTRGLQHIVLVRPSEVKRYDREITDLAGRALGRSIHKIWVWELEVIFRTNCTRSTVGYEDWLHRYTTTDCL